MSGLRQPQQQIYYVSANLLLDHAIIQGGCPSGAGCIEVHDLDPIFVDASGPDGIVGTARVLGARIDLGAYERQ